MSGTVPTPLDLSYQLGDLPDRAMYLSAAASCLRATVGGDVVGWNNLELVPPTVVELLGDPPDAELLPDTLSGVLDEHPLVRHYLAEANDLAPRRISDCLSDRQFRSSRVYSEFFSLIGAQHQLAILVAKSPQARIARSWAINRSLNDFSDNDVAMAKALQPMLVILDRAYPASALAKPVEDERDEARRRAGLTYRELDMITLLAQGLSAQQIARLRRISVRTVRKHLQNAYTKLECHDRILAVNRARHLGLL